MRDQPIMQEYSAISASEMSANAAQQKSILRKRTTSEGDALKTPRKDTDDIADLIGGGWKALGLDFDDDGAVPSVLSGQGMTCQVAEVKEFNKTAAKDINSFKKLGAKKVVDKSKFGGGPCLFGQGKVPVQQAVPTKTGPSVRVNMEDPSSLLKDGSGPAPVSSEPPKQLPLPPLLKKKDSTPMGALNSALTRALSQPGSRAASRPGSPSRMLSLPPDTTHQDGDISNLLSMAASDLQSSVTPQSSCVNHQQTSHQQANTLSSTNHQASTMSSTSHQAGTYQGIDNSAMSQIMQNTTVMKSNATSKQSVWGFSDVGSVKSESSSEPLKPLGNKTQSVSSLSLNSSFEINDPKPREEQRPAAGSFKPLEPSHQTHNSPIKVPKPVSPTEGSKVAPFSKKNPPPPVEQRGSVLAPKKDVVGGQQIGVKKTDYSYYLDLINDGSEEVQEEKCQAKPVQVKQPVQKSVHMEESISKNSVKSAKSMFESNTLQQSKNISKSCGNLNKYSMSACNGGVVSSQTPKSPNTQSSFNEPKLQGTESASASTQLKVQSGHNLASLLAKDDMQSSMLISEGFDQDEDVIIKESLVQNVKATSAKWNESIKKEDKVITFGQNVGGTNVPNSTMNIKKNPSMLGKTTNASSAPVKTYPMTQKGGYSTGLGLSSNLQNGNSSQYAGNPEQLLLKSMEAAKTSSHTSHSSHTTQVQQFHQSASMQKSVNGSASIAVLEHQKKIELERQKQMEYEMNQRKIVLDKDTQRNLISKQNDENELQLQLERRRSLENQLAEQQMQQQEMERRRQEALQIQHQEEERKKIELERQRVLEIQRQEEQRRGAEAERIRAIEMKRQEEERRKVEMERKKIQELQRQEEERRRAEAEKQRIQELQRQEEERRKAEAERQRIQELQRQEEERRKAEVEKQRLLEIQQQEAERKRQDAEKQRQLEIQRQQEEQEKAEAERQRLLEFQRQEEERLRLERERAIQLQKEEEERKREEEQKRTEEQRRQEEIQRSYEAEQRKQFQLQQAQLQMEAKHQQEMEIKKYQESQFQLEQQQRTVEMQSLQQSVGGTDGEREKRQKIHEEQMRLLRQKQEEEQKQLLLLHQQEEALWESKKNFIQKSSSTLESGLSQVSTSSSSYEVSSSHQLSNGSSSQFEEELETAKVHVPMQTVQRPMNDTTQRTHSSSSVEIEMYQPMEAVSASKKAPIEGPDLIEYSAPVIHDGSRSSSAQSMNIPSVRHSSTPETKVQTPTSPVAAATYVPKQVAPVSPEEKVDIVNDPLSFLLSDSPTSVSSSASSAAPTPLPGNVVPSAPAPPPVQPSYASIATGDAISELRSRFNETPLQSTFNDPVAPAPSAFSSSHNPPSKMHPPPQNNVRAPPPKSVPQSPTSSTREEVVSPNTQKKRIMAQCMSEVAGMKNASVMPSQMKAAKRKTTKSRVERFIEATCGEPETVVRKTASGQEYLEVISPEATELARSLLEPAASR